MYCVSRTSALRIFECVFYSLLRATHYITSASISNDAPWWIKSMPLSVWLSISTIYKGENPSRFCFSRSAPLSIKYRTIFGYPSWIAQCADCTLPHPANRCPHRFWSLFESSSALLGKHSHSMHTLTRVLLLSKPVKTNSLSICSTLTHMNNYLSVGVQFLSCNHRLS